MFKFEHPEFLYIIWILPLLVIIYISYLAWKTKAIKKLGDEHVVKLLMPYRSNWRGHFKFFLNLLILTSIIIALANPQIGSQLEKVKRKGIDIVIALDISNSMLAQDIKPSRLERAKQAINRLIDDLENDRIGLVVFAGKAYTQLPITTDYAAAKLMLSTVSTDLAPVQGTSIGKAIEMASTAFNIEKSGKAIIIISDGETHDEQALQKVSEAAEKGIRTYTIGLGLSEGAPIPVYRNGQITGFKKDRSGSTIITRLDETMLQQLAEAGKGIYVRASNSQVGLNRIFDEIKRLEQNTYDVKSYSDYEDRFQYFIAIALILMFVNFIINERKSRLADKLSLLNPNTVKNNK
ncbi:MAG TPA: VWA domain-containing protein [Lentimicrobium sp.]|nr:VWA domain-containing protein [Lentimicrobium sp.]